MLVCGFYVQAVNPVNLGRRGQGAGARENKGQEVGDERTGSGSSKKAGILKCYTEMKFSYPLLFAQSIVSNVLKIKVNFMFVKS